MAFADGDTVERFHARAGQIRLGLRAEVVSEILPVISGLIVRSERAAGIVAAVDHAVLATRVARLAVHHAVILPLHFTQHLLVAGIVPVGHQVTRRFPATNVARRNRPGRAGQLAFAGEEFLVNRRAEDGEAFAPVFDLRKFLARHRAREEEIFRLLAKTLDHVLLGGVVVVAGRDGVAVHFERGKVAEHVFQLLHLGLLIHGRVRRDLVAEDLGHLDGFDTFLEDAFALDDEVVGVFKSIDVNVPIHPFVRRDGDLGAGLGVGLADDFGVLLGNEFLGDELHELDLHRRPIIRRHEVAHFLAHENAVGADVNDTPLLAQPGNQLLNLRIDQRFAAANGDHRRLALNGGGETILQAHHVLEVRGIFADASAAGASEVAGVQRLKLQHHRKLRRFAQLVLDDVRGDLGREREGEPHRISLIVRWFGRTLPPEVGRASSLDSVASGQRIQAAESSQETRPETCLIRCTRRSPMSARRVQATKLASKRIARAHDKFSQNERNP